MKRFQLMNISRLTMVVSLCDVLLSFAELTSNLPFVSLLLKDESGNLRSYYEGKRGLVQISIITMLSHCLL